MFKEPQVTTLAEKYDKTPAQILLRFLTQKDIIVIPRSKTPERIKENIDIFDFALTDEEMTALTALDQKVAFVGNPNTPELVEMSLSW
jgi:diketogulonate reductase-like aldo/keto reductase